MEWWTHCRPDYDAHPMAKYTIMIRAPDDPERLPRPPGGQADRFPHHTIAGMEVKTIKRILLKHLDDGVARTLNRMGVELWDKTGDTTGGSKIETALWELCVEGQLAFTSHSPILFKRIGQRDLF